jgi:type II secretory pathway pseudopilin PulG
MMNKKDKKEEIISKSFASLGSFILIIAIISWTSSISLVSAQDTQDLEMVSAATQEFNQFLESLFSDESKIEELEIEIDDGNLIFNDGEDKKRISAGNYVSKEINIKDKKRKIPFINLPKDLEKIIIKRDGKIEYQIKNKGKIVIDTENAFLQNKDVDNYRGDKEEEKIFIQGLFTVRSASLEVVLKKGSEIEVKESEIIYSNAKIITGNYILEPIKDKGSIILDRDDRTKLSFSNSRFQDKKKGLNIETKEILSYGFNPGLNNPYLMFEENKIKGDVTKVEDGLKISASQEIEAKIKAKGYKEDRQEKEYELKIGKKENEEPIVLTVKDGKILAAVGDPVTVTPPETSTSSTTTETSTSSTTTTKPDSDSPEIPEAGTPGNPKPEDDKKEDDDSDESDDQDDSDDSDDYGGDPGDGTGDESQSSNWLIWAIVIGAGALAAILLFSMMGEEEEEEEEKEIDDDGEEYIDPNEKDPEDIHEGVIGSEENKTKLYSPTQPADSPCICNESGCFECPDGNCFACSNKDKDIPSIQYLKKKETTLAQEFNSEENQEEESESQEQEESQEAETEEQRLS